jgi:tripartite-type tricarboxylate transporter receptor subunit TctC
VIARLISKPLGDALSATVVIENRTGAAGNVGAAAVANATDGHTMLLSDLGSMAISPLISKDLPFKAEQLVGVTMLAYSPHLLAVHPSVPANTVQELVAWSQKNKINAASSGSGTPNHLGIVDIALTTGMKWQHVPYRGGAQAHQRHDCGYHPTAAERHGRHLPAGAGRQAQADWRVQAHPHGHHWQCAHAGRARRHPL